MSIGISEVVYQADAVRAAEKGQPYSPKINSIWVIANVAMLDPHDLTYDTETEHGKRDQRPPEPDNTTCAGQSYEPLNPDADAE